MPQTLSERLWQGRVGHQEADGTGELVASSRIGTLNAITRELIPLALFFRPLPHLGNQHAA